MAADMQLLATLAAAAEFRHRVARMASLPDSPHYGRYTDAVVTPPSITMVWPVMKVEASEAR